MPTFDFSLLITGEFRAWLVQGFFLSLKLTGLTLVFALPLATLVALLRLTPNRSLQRLGFLYVEGVRSVPLLVHLLFWYFAAPELLPAPLKDLLYSGPTETICAVVALTVYTAAYMAEDLGSGVRSVPPAQLEAGKALGLTYLATMRHVVLPQAMRAVVPPLVSQTLNLWKDTSVATVIGTAELMYQAQRVESASFRGFETFALATVAYLGVSLAITAVATIIQHRYPPRTAR